MNDPITMNVTYSLEYLSKKAPDLIYLVVKPFFDKVPDCLRFVS